jgi:hypothetical protein
MKTLLAIALALFVSQADAQGLSCQSSIAEMFRQCGAVQPGPAPAPTPIPEPTPAPTPPPPPSASCGPGEVMSFGDLKWFATGGLAFKDTQLVPVPPLIGSGDLGRAVMFVADAAAYPKGVQMAGIDDVQGSNPKDYVVSTCPHNFTPVGGNTVCSAIGQGSYAGPLYLRFGAGSAVYDCPLTPGQTYYINYRDYYTPRGSVSSQFVIYNRSD